MSKQNAPGEGYALAVPEGMPPDPVSWAEQAKELVLACDDIAQAQEMAAQAEGFLAYFRAKLGRASEEARAVAELEVLTRRRIGELIPSKSKGGRGKKTVGASDSLSRDDAYRARLLAKLPQADFDAYLDRQRKAERAPSVNGALEAAKKPKKKAKRKPKTDDPAYQEARYEWDGRVQGEVRVRAGIEVHREILASANRAKAALEELERQLRRNLDGKATNTLPTLIDAADEIVRTYEHEIEQIQEGWL